MEFQTFDTISASVRTQLDRVKNIWESHLGADLTGIYLHGSLCLGCFREGVSDLDILIVTERRLSHDERLSIAAEIINADQCPCPLEMSALWTGDLHPWQHPAPCQFHYSDYWTEHYSKLLSGEITDSFLLDTDFPDSDIACHVKLTRQSGIVLCGKPIDAVFPEVPEGDFWASISADIDEYDFNAYQPKYFASNILILGRILSYKKEGRILSKYDGGVWMQNYVPERYRGIVDRALAAWYEGKVMPIFPEQDLEGLRAFLIAEIKK